MQEKELLQQVKRRKLTYYGHITRKMNCLEKDLNEGRTPGYRTRVKGSSKKASKRKIKGRTFVP